VFKLPFNYLILFLPLLVTVRVPAVYVCDYLSGGKTKECNPLSVPSSCHLMHLTIEQFSDGFPTEIVYVICISQMSAIFPAHLTFLYFTLYTKLG